MRIFHVIKFFPEILTKIERFSIIRTVAAVERCDIAILMIDAEEGVTDQDTKIAGLIHEEGNDVVIQDLPFEYCRSRFKNSQDIDIVEFNVKFFDDIRDEQLRNEILKTYPKFVQKAYRAFKFRNGPKWIFLPAEIGIYFSFFEERPFFLDLIPLLDDLDDYKDIDKERNLQALKRILVQQVATDGMNLVFDPVEAENMHEGALEMLASNPDIDVLTTPEDFVGIIDFHVLNINIAHLAKHLRTVNHRVGHLQMVGIPQGRACAHGEMAVVDAEAMHMPERVVTLEKTIFSLYVAAFLDGGLTLMNADILQSQTMRLKQRAFTPKLLILN